MDHERSPRPPREKIEKSKHTGMGTMTIILIILGVALLAFTLDMIHIFTIYGEIPDTLCTCVFACMGGEGGFMAWIKTAKERRKQKEYEAELNASQPNNGEQFPPNDY